MRYKFGLVGHPLGHSLSPDIHKIFLSESGMDGDYELYPIQPERYEPQIIDLVSKMRDGEINGLNITIPYKQTIMTYVDELTSQAIDIGAVNTLYVDGNKVIGENTDAGGFLNSIKGIIDRRSFERTALILGAGGGARAVVYVLLRYGWDIMITDIDIARARKLVSSLSVDVGSLQCISLDEAIQKRYTIKLMVNATPVGMYPLTEESPWPIPVPFPSQAVLFDLVYNPHETMIMKQARSVGATAMNGLGMLVGQAALSFNCWTGVFPPVKKVIHHLEKEC